MGPVERYTLLESEDVAWLREDVALAAAARRSAGALARRAGFDERRTSEVELAVTEAATNLQRHARDGSLAMRLLRTSEEAAVEFLALDNGPGMKDVAGALMDGASTRGTMGVGLGTITRLADQFSLHSLPGRGTVLTARFWASRARLGAPARPEPLVAGVIRPIGGECVSGDSWAARLDTRTPPADGGLPASQDAERAHQPYGAGRAAVPSRADRAVVPDGDDALLVLMCDGLGHGPLAARAGDLARDVFRAGHRRHPDDVVAELHAALRGTRGAALGVARIELAARTVRFCGVGNISAFVLGGERRRALTSAPGIVGHQLPTLRTFQEPLPEGGALVMHSDGLTPRWNLAELPGLLGQSPVTIAAQLLNQAAVRRDDAGVVVAKVPR